MNNPSCRVLLIEDNPGDATLLERAMSQTSLSFTLKVVSRLEDGLEALSAGDWDVILADLSLPDSSGLTTVRALHQHAPLVALVVLTSLASDETAMQSLDEGAQDYLVKDHITPEILERAVRYAIQRQRNAEMHRLVQQLKASERILEQKNRRLAHLYRTAHRFVDNVSHEFRTPLTVIKEYISLLRDNVVGALNAEQKRMLDVAADRTSDLSGMVDDMLDVSKLEAGMLGLWRSKCHLADIVAHVKPNLLLKSSVKQIELTFDIPDDLPPVFCDGEKVGRVIVNLTTNAIKFCGQPGRVQLWASHDPARREILVGVTDNGEGIPEENLQEIFKRFRQLQSNPRGSTSGFGLGLNIAKELVHLNLGEINVKSAPGNGSTFWFTIPVAEPREVLRRYSERISNFRNGSSVVSLVAATVEIPAESTVADDVNTFLNTLLRRSDLVLRIDQNFWLLCVACEESDLHRIFERAEETRKKINRNRPGDILPPITFEPRGTWNVADEGDQMLGEVERMMKEREVQHV